MLTTNKPILILTSKSLRQLQTFRYRNICLEKTLVLHFLYVLAHGQSVEQLIKLVAEASSQIERFHRQDESFDKENLISLTYGIIRQQKAVKNSVLANRVTSFASQMAQIDLTAVVFVLSDLLYQIGAPPHQTSGICHNYPYKIDSMFWLLRTTISS